MSKQESIKASHKGISAALVAAQMEMGKALKQSDNPHFRSKYADLGNVMDACMPALNKHGIAVIQPTGEGDHGRYVKTILIHSESGDTLECEVPLILQKNDMQGYGSAVTYARRYGLMTMAGIAPEDDDGNAAAKAAPKAQATVSPAQFIRLRDLAEAAGVAEDKLCRAYGCGDLQQFPAEKFGSAVKKLDTTIQAKKAQEAENV
ncbi:ERF family protein [Ruegeria sp. HKCCA4812]|uniref:ERF family protein n=1 Tax=Ruegeria sp. HKCCA4812 TaxID=2682993 RepID=UPI00148806F4|nr:ERF family protein [Ruegeria sp. HKCCA4812]